jgi:4-hydroxybenzoyl-CoA thioesterase
MTYRREIQIEFNHCDPAGIVFYPRYFEMTNSVVENFFKDEIGRSFASMHVEAQNGVPTVKIEAEFLAPSRLGDMVLFSLDVLQIGRSSVTVRISGAAGDQARMRATLTLVWIDGMKAAAWPAQMRAQLEAHLEGGA